jgi:acyl-CoA thioester hydrolase
MTKPDSKPDSRGPASGWFEDRHFVFPLRVYYEDTDLSGVVYHATYLKFLERGRSEFLRASGLYHRGLLESEEPLVWTVRRMAIDYDRPARVDEALKVRTAIRDLSVVRMRLGQSIERDEQILTRAEVEVCLVTLDGRPRRIPDFLAQKLQGFLEAQ